MILFDDDPAWDTAITHLRLLSQQGISCYIKIRLKNGRLDRRTLKYLNDLASPIIKRLKEQAQLKVAV